MLTLPQNRRVINPDEMKTLHRFRAASTVADRELTEDNKVPQHCSLKCTGTQTDESDCRVRGLFVNTSNESAKLQAYHTWFGKKFPGHPCFTIDAKYLVKDFTFVYDGTNTYAQRIYYLMQPRKVMPLADFDFVAEMRMQEKSPCPFEAKLEVKAAHSISESGLQFSGPAFSFDGLLPQSPSRVLPHVMHISYEVLSSVMKKAEKEWVEPNLLFEVVWYALDLIYDPNLYLDALPNGLAFILFQLHFQDLAPYEYSSELSQAIAFALGLDYRWNCSVYETGGSVLLMSADPEETLSAPSPPLTGKSEWSDSEFAVLRRALSLPPCFYSSIIRGFREGKGYELVLSQAEDRGKGPPSELAQSILDNLHDGRLSAVVCGPLVVQMQFERDPIEEGVSVERASTIIKLLQQDAAVQELVMAVAAIHLRRQNDIPLRPFLIEQSPGYSLSAKRNIRFVTNTLCISVIAAASISISNERGSNIATGAVSIGRVVRDVLFPSSTQFMIWHCGDSLDIGEFVIRQPALWRHVLDTDDNFKQSLPQGLILSQGILKPHDGNHYFVLLSWDQDFNAQCGRVLRQLWGPADLISGSWHHMTVERPKRLTDSHHEV